MPKSRCKIECWWPRARPQRSSRRRCVASWRGDASPRGPPGRPSRVSRSGSGDPGGTGARHQVRPGGCKFLEPIREGSPTPRAPGTATPSGRTGTHRLGAHGSPSSLGAVSSAQAWGHAADCNSQQAAGHPSLRVGDVDGRLLTFEGLELFFGKDSISGLRGL